jgi:hypothetical protein
MVTMPGQEDVVADELAALESEQWSPLMIVKDGCPRRWGLIQFYPCAIGLNGVTGVRTHTPRSDLCHHGECPR